MQECFRLLIFGLLGLAFLWFTNQQEVPFTGRKRFITVGIDQAAKLGALSYKQILDEEMQQGNEVYCADNARCDATARKFTRTVREIGARLERAAIELEQDLLAQGYKFEPVAETFDWTYHVVENSTPNAFSLPGGYVAVYTGIFDLTGNNDGKITAADIADVDKLAVLMGHEIGHALAHHGAERMSQRELEQMGSLVVGLGARGRSSARGQTTKLAFSMAAQRGLLDFSSERETEADKIGFELLVRACYDPREALELWERMERLSIRLRPPEWMSTHPASGSRSENFRRWMPDAIVQYEQRCGRLR